MSMNRGLKIILLAALVAALISAMCIPALAQCAMCKANVANSTNGAAMAKTLNLGILVMLVPPVAIFCSIFVVAYKHRKGE
jgi:hypothetical protein